MVNIKVAVRIRPMSNREQCQRDSNIVSNSDKCILVTNPKIPEKLDGSDSRQRVRRFAVDYCYDPKYPDLSTQQAVFEEIGMEVVGHMLSGYNACVLAYGHSASGKTYTMMGDEHNPGLTPRICTELSNQMIRLTHHHVSVSFLEIYNEKVRDLLVDDEAELPKGYSLRVREHPKLGTYVQDLSDHVINTQQELLDLLNLGNSRRRTAVTESNASSSRSHAVFTIKFKQLGDNTAKYSKVHLVDLAGSERSSAVQSRTRMKEGANINKSLVTLGNVISALADSSETTWGKSWHPFVPYRDSVLTWLLKDTLGGNSNTIMIATISPGSSCYTDTINTLRYAKRTKKIINQPLINEDPKVRTIRELRDEISRLKTMLLSYTSSDPGLTVSTESRTIAETDSSSKWQGQGRQTSQCAVALQTDSMDLLSQRWPVRETAMEMPHDLLGHLEVISSSAGTGDSSEFREEWVGVINSVTPDILPCGAGNQHSPCCLVPGPHVCEINAGNEPGVNRVIADPVRLSESSRQKCTSGGIVPRVGRTVFKPRRTLLRRTSALWDMLHRSRPDLIKGIGRRASQAPTSSKQTFADPLSQSTSENSLHSSGSTESRVGPKPEVNLSRTSSVDNGSGSSTPTQTTSNPIVRPRRENKRAEIVASVTSRLYATKKKPDPRQEALLVAAKEKEDEDDDELDELNLCKRARMKLFDMSRKLAMTKKVKRTVDSDTQTETLNTTLRVKEKSVATEQQGVLQFLTSATNTPPDPNLYEPEPPVVMNQVFVSGTGKVVLECGGSSISLDVPVKKCDTESQTLPESKDQATSPEETMVDNSIVDYYSDDSLESDTSGNIRGSSVQRNRSLGKKFYSCQELNYSIHPMNHAQRYHSQPSIHIKKQSNLDFSQTPQPGVRVEKSLNRISRYNISGTNAFYEYDPNKSVIDKIIFSNAGSESMYGPEGIPSVVYPTYEQQLFHGSRESSEDALASSLHHNNSADNLSSETSSASLTSSIGSNESSSSDDFVFMESASKAPAARELYTISENSEASCSERSSPINTHPKENGEIIIDNSEIKILENNDNEEATKKIHWAEIECQKHNKFVNFNYTPVISEEQREICERFPSEDSITFVFLGNKSPQTSVLMEIIKRSLLGGSDQLTSDRRRKNKGVQCPGKLMRSVSVDTAMIALSRLSRQERSELPRTSSLSTVVSEQTQVNLDNEPLLGRSDNGVQCNFVHKIDVSCEIHPTDNETQCNLDNVQNYSVGTNTVTDKGTATLPEKIECTTQTDIEELFDAPEQQLPRTTGSLIPGSTEETSLKEKNKLLRKEMRDMILGSGRDLFPSYLASEDEPRKDKKKCRPSKTVSWSDLTDRAEQKLTSEEDSESSSDITQLDEHLRSNTISRQKLAAPQILAAFLRDATNFLQNYEPDSSDVEQNTYSNTHRYSRSSLLRRRKKNLTQLKVNEPMRNSSDCSVQTETEKIDRLIQTEGLAASLVGPPVRRSLTPNFRPLQNGENTVSNSTWPRRRISAKPPLSPRINRPGSALSRVTMSSANSSTPNRNLHSPRFSEQSSPAPYSPRREPNSHSLEKSCQRLQMAIALDKMRQKNLENCLNVYDASCIDGSSTNNVTGRTAVAGTKLLQYASRDYSDLRTNYNDDDFIKAGNRATFPNVIKERKEYRPSRSNIKSYTETTDLIPKIRSFITPPKEHTLNMVDGDYTDELNKVSKLWPQHDSSPTPTYYHNSLASEAPSQKSKCRCTCHTFSCGDLSYHQCHTCCVPCPSEPSRPYNSEPSLSQSEVRPSIRSSPLAHLRQLISVRRNIVHAEQSSCNN